MLLIVLPPICDLKFRNIPVLTEVDSAHPAQALPMAMAVLFRLFQA